MNVYLESFSMPSKNDEDNFFNDLQMTCFNSVYPFGLFNGELPEFTFEPITIFYGGNGCGKTTVLNVIAERIGIKRETPFNKSIFWDKYVNYSYFSPEPVEDKIHDVQISRVIPEQSRYITSDDVFQKILQTRSKNEKIDLQRKQEMDQYQHDKYFDFAEIGGFNLSRSGDFEQLQRKCAAQRQSMSRHIVKNIGFNKQEQSNGETAIEFFINSIGEESLYLLDEPENSLSAEKQLELAGFIANSARGEHNQFIIATHSPLLLALPGAKIYDLDQRPVKTAPWYELENPRIYYAFFKQYEHCFKIKEQ